MRVNVIMIGAPGAGKGTQAERLARAVGVPKVSTGEMLRDAVAKGTPLGQQARAVMDAGHLVGDEIMNALVGERIAQDDCAQGFVLDGYPRTVVQAEALDRMMAGRGSLIALHIVVPDEVLVQRLSTRRVCGVCGTNAAPDDGPTSVCRQCGGGFVQRTDDSVDIVRERLGVFHRQTEPLVEFYAGRDSFARVDGDRPAEAVTDAIRQAVARATATRVAGHG